MKNLNKRAHHCLSVFNSICDDYNQGLFNPNSAIFVELSSSYIRVLRSMTIEAKDLFVLIHRREPCDATRAYLIFVGKILLRLSYLEHKERIETDEETAEYFKDFNSKYLHGDI